MRLMFVSDIHGSGYAMEKVKEIYEEKKPDRLILLGDLLYHGPRNELPKEYDTKKVVTILNEMKDKILCVRGNCDAEVDQMVLDFPIMADYATTWVENTMLFFTHGHLYNKEKMPNLAKGDILIHGHTHVPTVEKIGDNIYLNPGSVSLPKEGNPPSYMLYENGTFSILSLEGKVLQTYTIGR